MRLMRARNAYWLNLQCVLQVAKLNCNMHACHQFGASFGVCSLVFNFGNLPNLNGFCISVNIKCVECITNQMISPFPLIQLPRLSTLLSHKMVWYFMLITAKQQQKQVQICHIHFKLIPNIFHTIMNHPHGKCHRRNAQDREEEKKVLHAHNLLVAYFMWLLLRGKANRRTFTQNKHCEIFSKQKTSKTENGAVRRAIST